MFKTIRNFIRKAIVDHRIKSGRYLPVKNGINAYHDMKHRRSVVKGYYDKHFAYATDWIEFK